MYQLISTKTCIILLYNGCCFTHTLDLPARAPNSLFWFYQPQNQKSESGARVYQATLSKVNFTPMYHDALKELSFIKLTSELELPKHEHQISFKLKFLFKYIYFCFLFGKENKKFGAPVWRALTRIPLLFVKVHCKKLKFGVDLSNEHQHSLTSSCSFHKSNFLQSDKTYRPTFHNSRFTIWIGLTHL